MRVANRIVLRIAAVGIGLLNLQASSAQSTERRVEFEVASIKPGDPNSQQFTLYVQPGGRFTTTNASLRRLVEFAYNVREYQITGGPNWLDSGKYTIEAKADSAAGIPTRFAGGEQIRLSGGGSILLMMQSLLTDRFQLSIHREVPEEPVYHLVVAKGGSKLKETAGDTKAEPSVRLGRGQISATSAQLSVLASQLSRQLGRVVIDQTGLAGKYDFAAQWTPDVSELNAANPSDISGPSIFTAMREQLGLRLESSKCQVEMLVIDRAERPSEN
jgi:bla regulator protein blaR1